MWNNYFLVGSSKYWWYTVTFGCRNSVGDHHLSSCGLYQICPWHLHMWRGPCKLQCWNLQGLGAYLPWVPCLQHPPGFDKKLLFLHQCMFPYIAFVHCLHSHGHDPFWHSCWQCSELTGNLVWDDKGHTSFTPPVCSTTPEESIACLSSCSCPCSLVSWGAALWIC